MQASLLREVIGIYVPSLSRNSYGEQVQKYEYLYSTKAYVQHSYGSRQEENNEIVNNYRKTFTIRAYHALNEKMYIRYNNKYWRILSIEPVPTQNDIMVSTELVNE